MQVTICLQDLTKKALASFFYYYRRSVFLNNKIKSFGCQFSSVGCAVQYTTWLRAAGLGSSLTYALCCMSLFPGQSSLYLSSKVRESQVL